LRGPHTGQQFVVNQLPARIGRGPDVSIALDADLKVSRKHAEVYDWNGGLHVRDLRSMHGTKVNGSPINDQLIAIGDQIQVGASVLVLREAVER
jgi:pSer/pThr/pTyr-binding forkhead associated (FHA) protein